jgi:hypothetical protein
MPQGLMLATVAERPAARAATIHEAQRDRKRRHQQVVVLVLERRNVRRLVQRRTLQAAEI